MKTAREMFEDLGYELKVNDEYAIVFERKKGDEIIEFNKKIETYYAQEYHEPMDIDVKTHKAIYTQMKELGWL